MDEKRMVGDYTVINSMYIGHREIILGENQKAASGERYVCCYAERVMFYEQYLEAQVSDDFAEIVKLYGERDHEGNGKGNVRDRYERRDYGKGL